MTSQLNFIKIYQFVQKLLGGTHRQADRQDGYLISLTFLFKESRLKNWNGGGGGGNELPANTKNKNTRKNFET
jgi:hypothetical protein